MTFATGWYRTLSTFSQTMPILNDKICLKNMVLMLFSKARLSNVCVSLTQSNDLFCYALVLPLTEISPRCKILYMSGRKL